VAWCVLLLIDDICLRRSPTPKPPSVWLHFAITVSSRPRALTVHCILLSTILSILLSILRDPMKYIYIYIYMYSPSHLPVPLPFPYPCPRPSPALHTWYGGGPALRRLVAPVPGSDSASGSVEVRVAMYPELDEAGRVVGGAGAGAGAGAGEDDDDDDGVDASASLSAASAVSVGRRGRDVHPSPIAPAPSTLPLVG